MSHVSNRKSTSYSGSSKKTQMAHTYTPERAALKKAYRGSKRWVTKVDKMDDQQVFAVYNRLKAQDKV